jgi:hypothetical protein
MIATEGASAITVTPENSMGHNSKSRGISNTGTPANAGIPEARS